MTDFEIEAAEDAYRNRLIEAVSVNGIYKADILTQSRANFLSSRKVVIREFGEVGHRCKSGCTCKSRSHERHKSQLRLERRGR